MIDAKMILARFMEQIEVKYLRAARQGCTDVAVFVDTTNQDDLRQAVAAQRGEPGTEVEAFVGMVVAGDRMAVANQLNGRLPGHEAVQCLADETPPEGQFPVLILMTEGPKRTGIHFFHIPKPEQTAEWI
jgi:hypothetical protein